MDRRRTGCGSRCSPPTQAAAQVVHGRALDPVDERSAQVGAGLGKRFDRVHHLLIAVAVVQPETVEPLVDAVGEINLPHPAPPTRRDPPPPCLAYPKHWASSHQARITQIRGGASPLTEIAASRTIRSITAGQDTWRCRESNPGPPLLHKGFSVRSPLCLYSDPPVARTSRCDDPSRCLVSLPAPRPG